MLVLIFQEIEDRNGVASVYNNLGTIQQDIGYGRPGGGGGGYYGGGGGDGGHVRVLEITHAEFAYSQL